MDSWLADGLVAPWEGRICVLQHGVVSEKSEPLARFVGIPGMNAVCKRLAADLRLKLECEVAPVVREGKSWRLVDLEARPLGTFDMVLVSAGATSGDLARRRAGLGQPGARSDNDAVLGRDDGLWEKLPLAFAGAFVHDSPLAWISRNSSKPERPDSPETWVLHASPDWSREHLEESQDEVSRVLLDEFWRATRHPKVEAEYVAAHRWRYSQPREPLPEPFLFDRGLRIGLCGDWCGGPASRARSEWLVVGDGSGWHRFYVLAIGQSQFIQSEGPVLSGLTLPNEDCEILSIAAFTMRLCDVWCQRQSSLKGKNETSGSSEHLIGS